VVAHIREHRHAVVLRAQMAMARALVVDLGVECGLPLHKHVVPQGGGVLHCHRQQLLEIAFKVTRLHAAALEESRAKSCFQKQAS